MLRFFTMSTSALSLTLASCLMSPLLAQDCARYAALLKSVDMARASQLKSSFASNLVYKDLFDACDRTDKFADLATPRKCSSNPNSVETIIKFADRTLFFVSKLGVDADGSPVAMSEARSSTDQPTTSLRYSDGSSINAEEVPFVVIPGDAPKQSTGDQISFRHDAGLSQGDLAAVFYKDKCVIGLVADSGPYFRLGEASLRAHENLGNPQCARDGEHPCMHLKGNGNGSGIAHGVTTIIFPGSHLENLTPANIVKTVEREGEKRLEEFLRSNQ